jgi:ribosomal protein S18 acetylase RimI-like enzyme
MGLWGGGSDDDYIGALSRGAFAEWARNGARAVRTLIREPEAHTEVAFLGDERVGFVVVGFAVARMPSFGHSDAQPVTRVAHLSAIAADPMMRRRGVGKRLLRRAEVIAVEHGAICLSLTTAVTNNPARTLFERAGYLSLAGVRDFYMPGQDAVFMHKSL